MRDPRPIINNLLSQGLDGRATYEAMKEMKITMEDAEAYIQQLKKENDYANKRNEASSEADVDQD